MNSEELRLLVAYCLGECAPEEEAQVRLRLDNSGELRRALDRVRCIVETMRSDDQTDAPAEVVRRAASLFRPAAGGSLLGALREVIASLIHDSGSAAAAAGLRGRAGPERHLVFRSDEGELDLRIETTADRADRRIVGQVDARLAPARVAFTPAGGAGPAKAVDADSSGVFLARVRPGRYALRVESGGVAVVVREIEVP